MSRQPELYFNDILESIERIQGYRENYDLELGENNILTDAVIRNLEVIGEAVKSLPDDIKNESSEVEWREIAGFRDVLIHQYFRINSEIVVDIVENKLPELHDEVEEIKSDQV